MASHIPDRASGRHAQQYAGTTDRSRLVQILMESATIALQSKVPDTAVDRRDLALEAYHQLREMNAHEAVHETIVGMVTAFPTRVFINEATGLIAKAAKLKTPKRKAQLLRQALDVLRSSTDSDLPDAECQRFAQSVAADLATLEGGR